MSVLLEKICIDPIFDKAKILAGKAGIRRRIVHRVSVFDCPYHKNIAEEGIIDKGDLFISCLEQFEVGSPEVRKSIEGLINRQAAGLIIVPSAKVEVLDFEILELCDKEEFPIILIKEEKPYAYIMSVVNGYISIEMENAINLLRLEKIRFGNLTSKEKMDMLYSINRNIQKNVMTIYVKGDFLRKWFSAGIWDNQIKNKQDTLVVGDYLIVILSNDDRKKLEQGIKAMLSQLRQLFPSAYFGLSRIYQVKDIKRILDEGENNGGGTGIGKAINGGFGLVLDGSELTDQIINEAIPWDTMVGVSRRNWARNKHSMETVAEYNRRFSGMDTITMPYIADEKLIDKVFDKYCLK